MELGIKKLVLLLLLCSGIAYAWIPPSDKARGTFLSISVGPRVPTFNFSEKTGLGYGFGLEISYTDNETLPVFLYGNIGWEQFPGTQNYYQVSDYTHYSSTLLPFRFGGRFYYKPMLENVVVILPFVEFSGNFAIYENLHQFKYSTGRPDFLEDGTRFGFSAGVGASMFLLEMLASYNYYENSQYLSFDMKVRIPLYVSF